MERSVTPGATQPGERPGPDGSRPGCPRFPRTGRQPARLGRSPSRSTSSVRPETRTCVRNRHNLATSGPSLTSGPITQRERERAADRFPIDSDVWPWAAHASVVVHRMSGSDVRYLIRAVRPCKRFCRLGSAWAGSVFDGRMQNCRLCSLGESPGGTDGGGGIGWPPGCRGSFRLVVPVPALRPGRCGMPENGVMKGISAGRSGWPHLAWAMWLPCVSAVVVAGLFVVVDLAGMVMGSWDTPVAGLGWLKAGAIGQFGLAIVAAAVLIAGAARPSWHRGAAITAYAIIALEIGWFLLTRMLVQDHP